MGTPSKDLSLTNETTTQLYLGGVHNDEGVAARPQHQPCGMAQRRAAAGGHRAPIDVAGGEGLDLRPSDPVTQ